MVGNDDVKNQPILWMYILSRNVITLVLSFYFFLSFFLFSSFLTQTGVQHFHYEIILLYQNLFKQLLVAELIINIMVHKFMLTLRYLLGIFHDECFLLIYFQ